jgi:hypothetical protein
MKNLKSIKILFSNHLPSLLWGVCFLLCVNAAAAKSVTVTNPGDSDSGDNITLRKAITSKVDTIFVKIPVGDTIKLSSALDTIKNSLVIIGNGAIISGQEKYRIMVIDHPSSSNDNITVTISGVHFTKGKAQYGGAIYFKGKIILNLHSCIFSNNQTLSGNNNGGGAINNNSGTLNILGCTFYKNSAYKGGVVRLYSGTTTFTGNIFGGVLQSMLPYTNPKLI